MMNFDQTFSSIYPCPQNGLVSILGGCNVIGLFIMGILYFGREKNRIAIIKQLGLYKEKSEEDEMDKPYKMVIIWHNVLLMAMVHLGFLYSIYLFIYVAKWQTLFWVLICECASYSISAGAHRLYAHHSYKASKLYEIIIMLSNCMMLQNSIIHWARDHRCHHKFVDTDADPHNSKRGLFFSQMGWLMVERHPEVIKQGRKIDISDLTSNPVLAFQRKYYAVLAFIFHHLIPISVPVVLWGEYFWVTWFCCTTVIFCATLNLSGLVNSVAHSDIFGDKPYSKNMSAINGGILMNLITDGEGDHNFHHAFPQDYRCSEKKSWYQFAPNIIHFCSWFGLTYDLNITSQDVIDKAKFRCLAE